MALAKDTAGGYIAPVDTVQRRAALARAASPAVAPVGKKPAGPIAVAPVAKMSAVVPNAAGQYARPIVPTAPAPVAPGPVPAIAPAPKPTWNAATDASYIADQQNALAALGATQRENTLQQQQAGQGYQQNLQNFGQQRQQGLESLFQDYSGRGLGDSGLYVDANARAMADYQAQQDQMKSQFDNLIAQLTGAGTAAQEQYNKNDLSLQQQAMQRFLAQLGGV